MSQPNANAANADLATLESYTPALRRYFRRHLETTVVEDLIQEVFVGMLSRGSDAPIENLDGYIFSVAANVLRRHQRREATTRHALQQFLINDRDDIEPSPERIAAGKESLLNAMIVIEALPPRTRDIFVLHRFEGMSYGAIARSSGISVSAVEKHIIKALQALTKSRREAP